MSSFFSGNYIALLIGLYFGHTPALIAAFYFIPSGHYSVAGVLICSLISTIAWDLTWYACGVGISRGRLQRIAGLPVIRHALALAHSAYDRRPFLSLFGSRFVYGLSSAAAVAAGWRHISIWLFLTACLTSMTGWFAVLFAVSELIQRGVDLAGLTVRGISVGFPIFFAAMLLMYYVGRWLIKYIFPPQPEQK